MSRPNTVIIPAYRPDERLVDLTAEVLSLGYSVIVVDDGNGEDGAAVFAALDSRVTILRHEKNRGKGESIKTGLAHVQSENSKSSDPFEQTRFVCIMNADGQHLPADMEQVMAAAEEHPKGLTLGVRAINKKAPLRTRVQDTITRGIFHLLTVSKVSDAQTGLRAFSVDLIPAMLQVEGTRYEYEMGVLAYVARHHLGFTEVPITTPYAAPKRPHGHSRMIRDSILIYKGLFKFAGSSFFSFLLDYVVFLSLVYVLHAKSGSEVVPVEVIANILARFVSGTTNYLLNCRLVFRRKPSFKTAGEYALLAVAMLTVNTGVLYLWKMTPLPISVCKLFTEICMFLANYMVQKRLIFRKKKKKVTE